jgi:small GTP-binding protein
MLGKDFLLNLNDLNNQYTHVSPRKTTIMKRVLGEDHHEISPTVGFNIKTLEYNGFLLNLWDVGGQKSIRAYWRNYFEQTDGIIWVVDSVDRWRMQECKDQLHDLLRQEVVFPILKDDCQYFLTQ